MPTEQYTGYTGTRLTGGKQALTPRSLRNMGRLMTLCVAGESATLSLPISSGTSPELKHASDRLSSCGPFPSYANRKRIF